jgi:two-component system cell cycle sensor histidine kinase/response regulator CckA
MKFKGGPMRTLTPGALYERIVESTSEGVWAVDADGVTAYVNQSMADMLGYERLELVDRSMFDVIDDEEKRVAEQNIERQKKGIAEVHELVLRRKDRRPLWTRLTTNPIFDDHGSYAGTIALVTDLTREREDEQERARLWQILAESLNEIYLFRERDLHFEYVNRGALLNLGYTLEEMRSMTPVDIKPLHTVESFRALIAPLVDGTIPKIVFRTDHRRKDGTRYPVEVHLQLVPAARERLFLAIIMDITERAEAERVLAASEARSRALIENSPALIALLDREGRVAFASPSVARVLGLSPEKLLGTPALDLVDPDDVDKARAALESVRAGETVEGLELRLKRADGGTRTVVASARNLLANPAVGALVINARDVTSERKLEEQLQQTQRLESIGRLAGGIAHDFNNILTAILSSASFLEEKASLSDSELADVHDIRKAGERAAELTSQLLAFARKRLIRPKSVNLGEIIRTQERFLRRVIGEEVELVTHVADDLWYAHVDPAQVEQVVLNLAVNARDAMPEGGRLTVEVENVTLEEGAANQQTELKPGSYVRLRVTDTGTGIAPDVLPHVFEPFFTTKPAGIGTGLGLATVYGIVRQSSGYIRVSSRPDTGTTFEVYFPRSAEPHAKPAPKPEPKSTRGTECVLVVEDDPTVRRMLVRALEEGGYLVHEEATPAEGLEWAITHQGEFALLVTDVVMPGMSGKELASRVRARLPKLRVLFVSGYTADTIVHHGVLEPNVEVLAKPFSPAQLRERVRAVLDAPP